MEFKDYYKILGVKADADTKTIKSAYRKLAHKYHPDMNPDTGAEAKFKDVAEAYQVLKDKQRRAEFDELKRNGSQTASGFQPPPGWRSTQSSGGAGFNQSDAQFSGDFSDFFNSLFGGGRAASGSYGSGFQASPSRGQDVEIELPIFLEDTIKDTQKTIEYVLPVIESGQQRDLKKHLKVTIPQGVIDGERIRLKGQGKPGLPGAEAGDLFLHIRLVPHPLFDVQAHDLVLTLPISPWEAALGTKVTIPTLEGKINLTIKPQSQSGNKLRVKGKGLKAKGIEGDLIAVIKVVMPPSVSDDDKALWQKLADGQPFDPRAEWRMSA